MFYSNFKDSSVHYLANKYIVLTLIVSISYYCSGCYKSQLLKEEGEIRSSLLEKARINFITTRNTEKYSFQDYHYRYEFVNDTLSGRAKQIRPHAWKKYENVKFSLSEIDSLEVQENNPVAIIAVSGVLVAGFVIFIVTTLSMNPL